MGGGGQGLHFSELGGAFPDRRKVGTGAELQPADGVAVGGDGEGVEAAERDKGGAGQQRALPAASPEVEYDILGEQGDGQGAEQDVQVGVGVSGAGGAVRGPDAQTDCRRTDSHPGDRGGADLLHQEPARPQTDHLISL